MKNVTSFLVGSLAFLGMISTANAQCPGGQVQLDIDVATDSWGYEVYWEQTPQGDACGTNTIQAFGNTLVGCTGGGAQVATNLDPGAYPDNSTINETLGCVNEGTCYTLHFVDDWGDGGATYTIYVDGVLSATYVGPGAGGSFDFCANAPSNFDVTIDSVAVYEYAKLPVGQLNGVIIPMEARAKNAGLQTVTNVNIDATVTNPASVYTGTAGPIASLPFAASQSLFMTPATFSPTGAGMHVFEFTASMTETDEVPGNDAMSFMVDVNDSVMARDDSTFAGSLGIGQSPNENGRLGQVFHAFANGTITSASAQFGIPGGGTPALGDFTELFVYEMTGGVPGAMLGISAQYTFTAADTVDGVFLTMAFDPPVNVTAGSDYLVAVGENAANIALATNKYAVTPGTNWVNWDSAPSGGWDLAENFGSQFAVQYVLRANFQGNANVSALNLNDELEVYPNPSNGQFTIEMDNLKSAEISVKLSNVEGKIILEEVHPVASGMVSIPVQVGDVENGVYLLEISTENGIANKRIAISK